jgi:DNA-binding CsgD family transcriptional regulator
METSPQCLDARLAWLNNGDGRYHEAMAAAQEGSEYPDDLSFAAWSMVELIEAAVRSGRVPQAVDALGRLIQCTAHSENNSTLGIVARCRALLEEGAQAEALFLEAIQRLEDTHVRGELARAHLLYGEWLRREGRRVDARRQLRIAHEHLSATGLHGFADRARRELMATGETVRRRDVETLGQLTPQEEEISRLAGSGYTNPEIGIKLFISDRTVEWHLRKVFAKVGITSRRQLRESFMNPEGMMISA